MIFPFLSEIPYTGCIGAAHTNWLGAPGSASLCAMEQTLAHELREVHSTVVGMGLTDRAGGVRSSCLLYTSPSPRDSTSS
eukprot:12658057-Prorocentrum_lima.AAC.1